MASINTLNEITTNELDYNILGHALRDYRFPRSKIHQLLQSGELIRVKKGLYVKADASYSLLVLAKTMKGQKPSLLLVHQHAMPSRRGSRRRGFASSSKWRRKGAAP